MAMAMERMRRTGSVRGRVGGVRRGTGGRVQWGGVENRTRSVGVSAQYLKRPPGAPAPAGMNAQQQQQRQRAVQDVDVDKENPQFVIFVRSSKIKMWYPLNLVSGGPLAKGLVSGLDNQFFKGMASGALVTQLKQAVYKDIDAVENAARKINKPLASAKKVRALPPMLVHCTRSGACA